MSPVFTVSIPIKPSKFVFSPIIALHFHQILAPPLIHRTMRLHQNTTTHSFTLNLFGSVCVSEQDPTPYLLLDHNRGRKAIASAHWHPSRGSVLCTASEDHHVYLWDVSQSQFDAQRKTMSLKPFHLIKTAAPLQRISWSRDGSKICILDRDNGLTLVDGHEYTESNRIRPEPSSTSSKMHCFVWSQDDRYIVTATKDGAVQCYDVRTLSKVHEFEIGSCFSLELSGDCKWIATGGADSMINIFDSNHLIQKFAFNAGDTAVNEVAFNWNSKLIASSSDDHSIKIGYLGGDHRIRKCIELTTRSPVHALKWHPNKHCLAFSGIPEHNVVVPGPGGGGGGGGAAAMQQLYNVNIWGDLKSL